MLVSLWKQQYQIILVSHFQEPPPSQLDIMEHVGAHVKAMEVNMKLALVPIGLVHALKRYVEETVRIQAVA